MDLLEQINDLGTTILLVTHDPELARRAQRNVHLVDGQLSHVQSPTKAVQSRPAGLGAQPDLSALEKSRMPEIATSAMPNSR